MVPEKLPAPAMSPPMPWVGGFHGVRVALVAMALAIMLAHVASCGGLLVSHVVLVLFGLGYPQALRLVSTRFERRRRRGRGSLLLDGFFAGALLPALSFDAVPSVVLVVISLFNWMAVGGVALSIAGGVVLLVGVGASAALFGYPTAVGSCGASSVVAYGALLLYLPFAAWVVFRYSAAMRHHCDVLQAERDGAQADCRKADQAVLAVLPPSVAAALERGGGPADRRAPDGTLLLIDVGAPGSAGPGLPALGEIFAVCDEILGRHGLERVKTLGRRYLALAADAAGPDQALAAAMEIADYFAQHRTVEGRHELRMVLHCGAVMAGLVQPARFNYDVVGAAVDEILSLAEQGVPSTILVSGSARARLSGPWNWTPVAGDGLPAFALVPGGAA